MSNLLTASERIATALENHSTKLDGVSTRLDTLNSKLDLLTTLNTTLNNAVSELTALASVASALDGPNATALTNRLYTLDQTLTALSNRIMSSSDYSGGGPALAALMKDFNQLFDSALIGPAPNDIAYLYHLIGIKNALEEANSLNALQSPPLMPALAPVQTSFPVDAQKCLFAKRFIGLQYTVHKNMSGAYDWAWKLLDVGLKIPAILAILAPEPSTTALGMAFLVGSVREMSKIIYDAGADLSTRGLINDVFGIPKAYDALATNAAALIHHAQNELICDIYSASTAEDAYNAVESTLFNASGYLVPGTINPENEPALWEDMVAAYALIFFAADNHTRNLWANPLILDPLANVLNLDTWSDFDCETCLPSVMPFDCGTSAMISVGSGPAPVGNVPQSGTYQTDANGELTIIFGGSYGFSVEVGSSSLITHMYRTDCAAATWSPLTFWNYPLPFGFPSTPCAGLQIFTSAANEPVTLTIIPHESEPIL